MTMKNIILIGMPGCGKTTVGRMLAEELGVEFYDTDNCVERDERLCIREIFKNRGEKYFRDCETRALKKLVSTVDGVIATGGGIVLKSENVEIMKDTNSLVVFIDRPLQNIVADVRTDSRPLLAGGVERIYSLYDERYDKYLSACDERIINDDDMEKTVCEIIKLYKERRGRAYENNGN